MKDKELYENLDKYVDSVVSSQEEDASNFFAEYVKEKAKKVLSSKHLKEFGGGSQIKLDGDDVMVSGKKVGEVKSDPAEMDAGISFTTVDGSFSKEFNTLSDLYEFLSDRFNVKEGRVEDAVLKQDDGREARKARWTSVRKTKQKDGKPGDYESMDTKVYDDPVKGKSDKAAFDGHEKDARHKKGYYDSHDPRKTHKDPVRGGSEAAHDHGKMDMDGYYDSHDVRKNHNS
jgi:hypothetical protein